MSDTTETVIGTALARVLHRSLNLKKGQTEVPWLRGDEGWSKRAKSVIDAFNRLLEAHDDLSEKMEGADQDAINAFNDLTRRIDQLAQTRVSNKGTARSDHKRAIEDLIEEVEKMALDLEEAEKVVGRIPPPPPPPPMIEMPKPLDEDLNAELDGDPLDRTEWLGLLRDVQQELHQACAQFGGLSFCAEHVLDFPKKYQTAIMTFANRDRRRVVLLKELNEAGSESEIEAVGKKIRGLHAIVGHDTTALVKEKQDTGAEAVELSGLGEEAQTAIKEMTKQWRSIKITDAPNPYYGKKEAWEKSGMSGEVLEHYNPANRYLHVDGDQFVNGPKSAASVVARKEADKQVPSVEEMREQIAEQETDSIKKKVIKERTEDIEQEVIGKTMDQWYRTGGADILEQNGLQEVADLWRKGELDFDKVPGEVSDKITQAAKEKFESYKQDSFETDVEEGIKALVEKEIDTRAKSRRNAQVSGKVMEQGDYWAEVGRLTKSADFGRCFSCAGVAVHSLVMNPAFDGKTIESVGAVSYDHHFVLVGRSGGEVGSTTPPDIKSNVLVIDIWQANQGGDSPAINWKDYTYNTETKLKVFAVLKPADRAELRKRCEQYAETD